MNKVIDFEKAKREILIQRGIKTKQVIVLPVKHVPKKDKKDE